jgi:phosphonate transport system permease protein
MWKIFRAMFPPAFQTEIDRGVVGKVFESLYIAWIGTIIAATLSFPLSFLAAGNVAPRWIRYPIRQLFNAIRAVPELIVAMVLLAVVGLGPWAGALAIGLHSIGTLGKLSTEAIENADSGPLEAISASGGTWISGMRWGMVPQVLPTVISYWLFRFEINIRASTVLGLIGAGGVGSELSSQLAFRNFPQVGAVLAFTVALVLVIDTISGFVRRQVISGTGRKVDGGHNEALVEDMLGSKLAPKK